MNKVPKILALFFLSMNFSYSQDIMTLKNGGELKVKVVEIDYEYVKYFRYNSLNGPLVSMDKSSISKIRYQNGKIESLNAIDGSSIVDTTSLLPKKVAKMGYAFEKNAFFISPQIGFTKYTTNNFGLELEYGLSNLVGLAISYSRGQFADDFGKPFNLPYGISNKFSGIVGGLRLHTAAVTKSKMFDIMPGLFYVKPFNNNDYFDYKPALGGSIDMRFLVGSHVGFMGGISKSFLENSNTGYSLGLVFKLN
jgi:hypothetical protein